MKDSSGKVIYVGKAKSLRHRVRAYFSEWIHTGQDQEKNIWAQQDARFNALVSRISDFEALVTDSEMEALILESNLVKEYKPRYNVNLKDDKRYPYIKITTNEPYPRVLVVRRPQADKAKYFGPYTNVKAMRQTLRLLRRIFPVRSCNYFLPTKKKIKLCLDFYIKRCLGPCEDKISQKEYTEIIKEVILFLAGKNSQLLEHLKQKMNDYAQKEEYEKAAAIRDQILGLESVMQKQKVVETEKKDKDIIAFARLGKDISVASLQIREGALIGRQHFYLTATKKTSDNEVLSAFVKQYYMNAAIIPQEIILPTFLEEQEIIERWLWARRDGRVKLIIPQKGEKFKLLKMAEENAQLLLKELLLQKEERKKKVPQLIEQLQKDLYLKVPPRAIAAFDISNIGSADACGSLVFFEDGRAKKSEYRRFKIKTVEGQDDFAMIGEVVGRYFRNLQEEKKKFPDLVLIDGGKGQLSSAIKSLNSLGIPDQNVIGLAKRLDEVFLPERPDSLMIPKSSSSLRLLQRIRDEAHRFALGYHRKLRTKRTIQSELDQIPGIGEKRRRALLTYFGSVKRIGEASIEEIAKVQGIPSKVAEEIHRYFHSSTERKEEKTL